MIHVGFTGTRSGMTERQKERVWEFVQYKDFYAHHGDCVGADAEFDAIVRKARGCLGVVIHPPLDESKRAFCPVRLSCDGIRVPKLYLERNKDIVRESDIMVATPRESQPQARSGTWSTIREAERSGKPLAIVFPNGSIAYVGSWT